MSTSSYISLAIVALVAGICIQWVSGVYSDWRRAKKEAQFNCLPVHTLKTNPWLLGLDVAKEMTEEYRTGSRNTKLQRQFNDLGTTFRTQASDAARIFTIDQANVKAVFANGDVDLWGIEPIRLDAFRPAIGAGVLVTDGARWKHSRKLCQGIIDKVYRSRLSYLPQMDGKIQDLINCIPTDGTTVDLLPLFNMYLIDSATEYIMGGSVNSLKHGEAGEAGKKFVAGMLYHLKISGESDELPQWTMEGIKARLWHRNANNFAAIHTVTDQFVQAALKQAEAPEEKQGKTSLATEWAKLTKDPLEIRYQLLNVMTAAFDTTAVTLQNAFFHLSRHPEMYQKLRDEVINCDENVTADQLKGLTYLNYVLKEVLRLNTPGTLNSRMALSDTSIPTGGGPDGKSPIFVQKGDIVVTSIYATQRNPAVYGEDADAFRPERWETTSPKHWDYTPFSAGHRVCPGQYLAQVHALYVLFYLVRYYSNVECRDPTQDFVEFYQVTTASKNGVKVAMFTE